MGIWCFTFADMAWYARKAAAALFASPPTSTYEEALGYFMDAEKVDPGFYTKNALFVGKTHLAMGDKAQAKV